MEAKVFLEIDGKVNEFNTTEDATAFLMRHNKPPKKQNEFVIAYLLKHGKISRNFALASWLTRLSARICNVRDRGYDTTGAWDAEHKDYIYTLIKKPQ